MICKYLWYVLRHKWFVFVATCNLGIPWRGLVHDLSKLRPSELLPYARFFYGDYPTRRSAYEKYFYAELPTKDSVSREFDRAWLRHIHRNKHHWQYWILREDDGGIKLLEMPDCYRREMLADWQGAGRAQGTPDTLAWYAMNRERLQLSPETRRWVEDMLQFNEEDING